MDQYDPNPVETVLSIDEVLELILEYSAAREDWGCSSNLRLVSKRWRSLSFRGLCQSTQIPQVRLRDWKTKESHTPASCRALSLETFKKNFPKTSPRKLNLFKPVLPIELQIERCPTPAEFSFIQDTACHIATVILTHQCHQSPKPREPFTVRIADGHLESKIQLPNLRSLFVDWKHAVGDPLFEKIVEMFGNSCKRLSYVKYEYPIDTYSENWPKPPSNLTHLTFHGSVAGLNQFTKGLVKTLSGMVFTILQEIPKESLDCSHLTEILQRHCKTLNNLTISCPFEISMSGAVELHNMESLRSLSTVIPIRFKQDEQPKLRHVAYTIGHHPGNVSAALEMLKLSSHNLERLQFKWVKYVYFSIGHPDYTAIDKECEETFLRELDQGIPFCPQLKEVTISKFPFRVGITLMPRIYEFMTNLTKLCVYFQRSKGQMRPSKFDNSDFFKILTGCDPGDVPTDELMWPKFLTQRNGFSIASLKNLKLLKLKGCERLKCVLGRFIFRAGFMQMSQLQKIVVRGGILVDEVMISEWKECGRSIDTEKSVYHGWVFMGLSDDD